MRFISVVALVGMVAAACSPTPGGGTTTSSVVETTPTTGFGDASISTVAPPVLVDYPVCDYDEPWPDAPDDWYRDTPVYVGNESPTDAVRRFASGIPGFETVWIDRDHNGWVSAGFVGADIEEVQELLEAEFPDDGVVAVGLSYTRAELEAMAGEIDAQLPEEMHAANVQEIFGRVEIYIGLATPENVAVAEDAAGDAPYCLEGLDPVLFDQSPQAPEGDGWIFLGVVEGWPDETEIPLVLTDQPAVDAVWGQMAFEGGLPTINLDSYIAVAFPVLHSGSCPDQRFDGIFFESDRVLPDIKDTTIAQACTDDGNPRTFLVGVERMALPAEPVHWVTSENDHMALEVNVDLRVPGSIIGPGDSGVAEIGRPRIATGMPHYMEPGNPWEFVVPADCDLSYIGDVNGVGWHLSPDSEIPTAWAGLAFDRLIDLQITLIQEPDPIVILTGAGEDALYLPGDKPTPDCQP